MCKLTWKVTLGTHPIFSLALVASPCRNSCNETKEKNTYDKNTCDLSHSNV